MLLFANITPDFSLITSSPPMQHTPPFELKATSFTLPTIFLMHSDIDLIADGLAQQVDRAPGFFHNTPVAIDLSRLPHTNSSVNFPVLVGQMRGNGMIPIGIRGGSKDHREAAEMMELAILSDGSSRPIPTEKPKATPEPAESPIPNRLATKIITRPVRSGQRIYAPDGDLIVTAPISSGAEIMADGNIHIYSTLRGRAMAGVKGDIEAQIFCNKLEAELVSIAGSYKVSENFDPDILGKQVQIQLSGEQMLINKI